jgi:formate dehydrogenase subunit beta
MDTQWMIPTHGDPLGAVRGLVHTAWEKFDLQKMLVLSNGSAENTRAQIIADPKELDKVNPFTPLMPLNGAKLIPDLMRNNPKARVGAMLRPCEMRALIEIIKRKEFDTNRLVTLCVDCLGTLPADEYQWRAERKGTSKALAQETIQFARQGGIVPYRYRSACQMCISPKAENADINVGILGLPARQHIFISTKDSNIAECLRNGGIPIDPKLLAQHQRVVSRMVTRTHNTRERITNGLADFLPADVEALVDQLESCGDCQVCLNTCPISAIDPPQRGEDGRYDRDGVARWLVSCSGCGMCEQSCPNHLPLSIIFGHIRDQLAAEHNYIPGHSEDELLPI